MSTDYRPLKDIAAHEMFDGRLKTFGVRRARRYRYYGSDEIFDRRSELFNRLYQSRRGRYVHNKAWP